ncbi:MAG: tetratricopeptide repeat protein [Acidobacteriaceae bacterium]|nr:tetratricopeptide repeat protein [Acidobacteriaceae bacterium]
MSARFALAIALGVIVPRFSAIAAAPDFATDIAPILYSQCASCHHAGGVGPFALVTYDDAKRHAHQIAAVTATGYMPPWPPDPGFGDFQGERKLTARQIQAISEWVKNGCPQGNPESAPPPPVFSDGWQLGKPDLILQAKKPLHIQPGGTDVFWNFLFKPDLKQTHYIRAIEIKPTGLKEPDLNSPQLIHHANLLIDRSGSSLKRERNPGEGFGGMDLAINRNPLDPDSHFLFWKPGSQPYFEPPGFAWRLDPGNVLVLNTHLQPSGKAEEVPPAIGLYFTDEPPRFFPLLIQLEADEQLNIPAGARHFRVTDDLTLPEGVSVLAVYPHAHYLGTCLEGFATLPDGTRRPLIRISHWDLNWQSVYRYREPLHLPKGTVVSMRYEYDNSAGNVRNPNHPPKRVVAGNDARDEMAHLWLQVLPDGSGDRRRPIQEALLRHRLEKTPGDYAASLGLGALAMARLDPQSAIPKFEGAIRADPSRSEAHDMLGAALRNVGRFSDALIEFQLAVRLDPGDMQAHYNLANALVRAGKWDDAVHEMKQVAAAYPESARIQAEFGFLLYRAGDGAGASTQFRSALKLDPANKQAAEGLALVSQNGREGK